RYPPAMISTVVWGTGNVGRAAVRAVAAHPAPDLTAVPAAAPAKVGRDAGELAGLDERLGVAATDDVGAGPAARPRAVVSAASGEIRPDAPPEDIARAVRSGAVVVTPSVYGLYDQRNAPPGIRAPLLDAVAAGGGPLFVSGVDPGWADDVLPLLISGIASRIDPIRCQEIFDYSTYDREDSVRHLVGMGQPMDHHPPDAAGVRAHRGVGRTGAHDGPGPGRRARRDDRDRGTTPAARHGRHRGDGRVPRRNPGRRPRGCPGRAAIGIRRRPGGRGCGCLGCGHGA